MIFLRLICGMLFLVTAVTWIVSTLFSVSKSKEEVSVWENVRYSNQSKTEDNPCGYSVGEYVDENGLYCLFITPNTAIVLRNVDPGEEISYKIHSQVQEISDGAVLIMEQMDEESGSLLHSEELTVSVEEDWTSYVLNDMDSTCNVRISCKSGIADDETGDWVIIKKEMSREEDRGWIKHSSLIVMMFFFCTVFFAAGAIERRRENTDGI